MSSLPTELDFAKDPAASPERMNRAMSYVDARFRALEAINPEFQSVIDQLKSVGLERVTDALLPIFVDAQNTQAAIAAIFADIQSDATVEHITDNVTDNVTAAFADYRNNYLGAKSTAPTVRPDGSPVAVGCLYFDTTLDQMRVFGATGWKNAGSSVAGVMAQIDPIVATAGQTVFTVPGGYEAGYLIATLNGTVLPTTDYTATNGSTVTLASSVAAGDEFAGIKFGSVTLATVYDKTTADAKFRTIADSYTKAQVDTAISSGVGNVYTKTQSDARYPSLSLSNLPDAAAARTSLGLGTAAVRADNYFARVTSSSYTATGGYRIWSDGFKECWGFIDIAKNSYGTFNFPIPFTSFVVPITSYRGPGGDVSFTKNTSLSTVGLEGITAWNASDALVRLYLKIEGV